MFLEQCPNDFFNFILRLMHKPLFLQYIISSTFFTFSILLNNADNRLPCNQLLPLALNSLPLVEPLILLDELLAYLRVFKSLL
jgi:hypothetical protein